MKVLQKKQEALRTGSFIEMSRQVSELSSDLLTLAGHTASGIEALIKAISVVADSLAVADLTGPERLAVKNRLETAFDNIGAMGHDFPGIRSLASLIHKF